MSAQAANTTLSIISSLFHDYTVCVSQESRVTRRQGHAAVDHKLEAAIFYNRYYRIFASCDVSKFKTFDKLAYPLPPKGLRLP